MSWRSPSLGVVGEAVEDQLAAYFGVKEGVLVRSVVADSAAEKAGIKAGDVIVKVDEDKVATPREITNALRSGGKKSVNVALMRDRKEMAVTVTLPEPNRPAGRATRVTTPRQFE
jgi:S1-C subfamily serine protease